MKRLALLALFALCACGDPKVSAAQDAERQYEMMISSSLQPEKCEAARKVRQAWLEAGDKANFELWDSRAYNECAKESRYR